MVPILSARDGGTTRGFGNLGSNNLLGATNLNLGFDEDRLKRIGDHLDRYVEGGKIPCAACLVSRGGQEAYIHVVGQADVERNVELKRDAVFRAYSMTKPVTSVALMMLYESGHFQLDDPVSKYVPSWDGLRVFESGNGEEMQTVEVSEPMTIKHLLTHTSGLTYGFMQSHPIDALYRERQIGGGGEGKTLTDMVSALGEVPLLFQPGSRWHYSVATDVCGYLVELFSGQDLDVFVRDQICTRLSMKDSGFHVPDHVADRLTACYQHHPTGFRLQDDPVKSRYLGRPTFFSGGGGMVTTLDDYNQFAQMLLRKGELHGERLLGRKTVEYMASNHLPGNVDLAAMGQAVFSETSFAGVGFGLGFSVVLDPAASSVLDSPGDFAWGGAASTYFWVDPIEEVTVVFMTQLLPSSTWPIRRELKTLIYQSLT